MEANFGILARTSLESLGSAQVPPLPPTLPELPWLKQTSHVKLGLALLTLPCQYISLSA